MVLDSKRQSVEFIIEPVAKALSRFHPNTVSWLAFVLSIVAGVLIFISPEWWQVLLPLASIAVLASGFFDALDGKVARLTGKASRRGDLLDHVLDRYADIIMIGAVAVSAWCSPYIGIVAIIGVLLTSYMGTQAQAIGAGRLYSGLLGRADRVVLLIAAPLLQMLFFAFTSDGWLAIGPISLSAFELVMLWFAVVGNITAVQRALKIWKMVPP
ncbi:CDP-alcohol phosphatidyltransferase family protein [Methanomassiliicoccus luminyensis]|uniref:CDP-alcohol phosphatidyltransferase family protein n=1 Tax=Methanomassiliicoccus luminyensis TaxID=1080712 RepID=UPI000674B4D4|nr:CDP-alcohol phosphatidyltransferase family protein [Methanomassiliicoccus luminyensis]